MKRLLFLLALPLWVSAASADGDQGAVSLTIYNSNLALVQDIRHLTIAAGRSRLEFKDVSGQIRPETVALSGQGLSVVEQNYDFDLLTPAKMMEKQVGKQVQIVRTNPGTGKEDTETATVLSVNAGVVLKIGDKIEVLRDDGIPTKVIFDGIPENLRARPTLSVTVGAEGAGPRDVTLSYLSTGLSWNADYVAQFDEKQNVLALQGWVTLTNNSGTGFSDANVRVVAGDVSYNNRTNFRGPVANRSGGSGSDAQAAEDFPIYSLPERVSVANNQTKQVGFLDASLPARKSYRYQTYGFASQDTPTHAAVMLDFSNTGKAMPAGTVRVYTRDVDGTPKFIGEQEIDQTPAGSDLSLRLGEAFDVTVQPTILSSDRLPVVQRRARTRFHMSYELRNAGDAAVTVALRQGDLENRDAVSEESQAGKVIDAGTREWQVHVPAHGATTLTFTAITSG